MRYEAKGFELALLVAVLTVTALNIDWNKVPRHAERLYQRFESIVGLEPELKYPATGTVRVLKFGVSTVTYKVHGWRPTRLPAVAKSDAVTYVEFYTASLGVAEAMISCSGKPRITVDDAFIMEKVVHVPDRRDERIFFVFCGPEQRH